MIRFIVKRIILMLIVIVCAAILIFAVMYFVPGDPVELMMPDASLEDIALKKAELGLDQPFLVQLCTFLYNAFIRFDLGVSWNSGSSVMEGLLTRLPRTFTLGVLTVLLTCVVGIPLGISAAINRGKWQDRLMTVLSMVFISIPEFWLALMLIILFSLKLGWLPSMGIDSWACYILPVVAGAISGIAQIARQTRASVLEVIRADYITTIRAKGMNEQGIIYKHMLPNALIPVITVVGGNLTRCVGGTLVLEKIFSFPGIGLYISDAISMRDYPVIRGGVIMIAAFTAFLMLFVDLAYGFVDPQIRAQYADSGKRKGRKGRNKHGGTHPGGFQELTDADISVKDSGEEAAV